MSTQNTGRTLIASCGNVLAGDDAFGPRVTGILREMHRPAGVQVLDLDIKPTALLEHLCGQESLIIVDAAVSNCYEKGKLLALDWFMPDRPQLVHDDALSTHGLSLANQIELAATVGVLPQKVTLIAMIVAEQQVGESSNYVDDRACRQAAELVLRIIRDP